MQRQSELRSNKPYILQTFSFASSLVSAIHLFTFVLSFLVNRRKSANRASFPAVLFPRVQFVIPSPGCMTQLRSTSAYIIAERSLETTQRPLSCFTNHGRDFDSARDAYTTASATSTGDRTHVRTDGRTRDLPVARKEINWRVMVGSSGVVCSWR